MPALVVPVSGTWGRKVTHSDPGSYTWWKPGSVWIANLRNAGLDIVSETDYFDWSTNDDGVFGHNDDWETAGKALYWYWVAHGRPSWSFVLHSHAAQVFAYALLYSVLMDDPMRAEHTVTIGSPVREDMQDTWNRVAGLAGDWTHLYTDEVMRVMNGDLGYQRLGSEPITPAFPFTRLMSQATRNVEIVPPVTHHWLSNARLWNDHDLWQYLKP